MKRKSCGETVENKLNGLFCCTDHKEIIYKHRSNNMTKTIPLKSYELQTATACASKHKIPLSRVFKAINAFGGDVAIGTIFINTLSDAKKAGVLKSLSGICGNIPLN